ncbi:MAG TPA: carboxypeptidase-like regulatory domain-containing protein [Acidobacteriaceae bacterium]|jgi:uncharacterized membrane protein|nr:carboxypeptidase-like regulatory domain-containing protein [Acidobacteriaceae bacterium]
MQIKTRINLRQIATLSIAFVILSAFAGAQEARNTPLIVSVTDMSGAGVRSAHITLTRDETTTEIKVDADENGRAEINVEPGSYRLSVGSPGFFNSHQQIEVRDVSQNIEVKLRVGSCPPGSCFTVSRPDTLEPASPPLDTLWISVDEAGSSR